MFGFKKTPTSASPAASEDTSVTAASGFLDFTQDKHLDEFFGQITGGALENGENSEALPIVRRQKLDTTGRSIRITRLLFQTVFLLGAFFLMLCTVDIYLRAYVSDTSAFSGLPVCDYLTEGIEGYENVDCLSLRRAVTSIQSDSDATEKTIFTNLLLILPAQIKHLVLENTPEIRFISETLATRHPVVETFQKFDTLRRKSSRFDGADIECKNFRLDSNSKFSVTCDIYGIGITDGTIGKEDSNSSRIKAIKFLEQLEDPSSGFVVDDFPTEFGIRAYNGSDAGIRSLFTTQTTIQLTLRYIGHIPTNRSSTAE